MQDFWRRNYQYLCTLLSYEWRHYYVKIILYFSAVWFLCYHHTLLKIFWNFIYIYIYENMYRLWSRTLYGCSWWNLMIYNICGDSLEEGKPLQWRKRSSAGVDCLGMLWEVRVCWVFKNRLDKQLSVLVWLMLPCGKGMKQITCWVPSRAPSPVWWCFCLKLFESV